MTAAVARPRRPRPRRRLNGPLLASLLAHALLLSLSFGDGLGLPGLALPWQDRRTEVPALRVVLTPQPYAEPAAAEPLSPVPWGSLAEAPEPSPGDAPATASADAPAEVRTLDEPEVLAELTPPARLAVDKPAAWAVPAASAVPAAVVAALPAASAPAVESLRQASELLRPRIDTRPSERASALAQLDSPDAPALPAAAIAALSGASGPGLERLRRAGDALRASDSRERAAELAQLDSARQDTQQRAQRLEAARQEALRQEAARADAARLEAERQEAARLAAARQEAARLEAARQEARLEARLETQRQAAARDEATRQETARQEAARADAVRQEAARLEAARQEGLRKEAARVAAVQAQAQAEVEQREARLRAIGRQLDEEAAKRDAARQRPDWTPARRGRLFGRTDSNAELVLYAEAWARKIQLNPTLEMAREAAQQPYIDPIVTVAVRSDGSVESITLVRSSGVPALDEAVRRIVLSQERYPAFQPALLRDFDVVEIRRSWHFDSAVRLY